MPDDIEVAPGWKRQLEGWYGVPTGENGIPGPYRVRIYFWPSNCEGGDWHLFVDRGKVGVVSELQARLVLMQSPEAYYEGVKGDARVGV